MKTALRFLMAETYAKIWPFVDIYIEIGHFFLPDSPMLLHWNAKMQQFRSNIFFSWVIRPCAKICLPLFRVWRSLPGDSLCIRPGRRHKNLVFVSLHLYFNSARAISFGFWLVTAAIPKIKNFSRFDSMRMFLCKTFLISSPFIQENGCRTFPQMQFFFLNAF